MGYSPGDLVRFSKLFFRLVVGLFLGLFLGLGLNRTLTGNNDFRVRLTRNNSFRVLGI